MFPKQLLCGSMEDAQSQSSGGSSCQVPGELPPQHPPPSQRGQKAQAEHSSPQMLSFFHLPNNAVSEIFKRTLENTDVWSQQGSKRNKSKTNSPTINTNTEMLHESPKTPTALMPNYKVMFFPPKKLFCKEEVSPFKIFLLFGKTHLPDMTPAIASLRCLTGCPTNHSTFF